MSKQIIGIDIGDSALKLAVCTPDGIQRLLSAELPENMANHGRVLSPGSMSEFLRELKRNEHISARDAAIILPEQLVFFRQLTVPAMTVEQLRVNLPYEFRDYITHEKSKYFYDYAVVGRTDDEEGQPVQFELLAAATLKETIADYRDMLKRAGLRLRIAVPPEMAWSNLLHAHEVKNSLADGEMHEYCVLDIGHTSTRVHLFHGRSLEMSKVIDYGCSLVDSAIAETRDVDEHVARTHKEANLDNAQTLDACIGVYNALAIEVRKALNFHAYEHRDNHLSCVYYCGGGALIEPLIAMIRDTIDLPLAPISAIMPAQNDEQSALLCAAAVGAAAQ